MKFWQIRVVRAVVVTVCSIALIVVARLWYLEEQGNFHPITQSEAYRSAQLDRDELEHYIRKFKIRSIINLSGENSGEQWYEEEVQASRKLNVSHFDLGLSADKAPSSSQIEKLLELFRLAPRPVLIHCNAGADRSGTGRKMKRLHKYNAGVIQLLSWYKHDLVSVWKSEKLPPISG